MRRRRTGPWATGLLVATLLTAPLFAEDLVRGEAPAWVETKPWTPKTAPDKVEADYEDLVREVQVNLTNEEEYYRIAFRYLSSRGVQNGSTVRIDYQPEYQKAQLHTLKIWRKGQPIDQRNLGFQSVQREQSLEEATFSGLRTWVGFLQDVRPGDVLELAYSLKGRNPVFGSGYFDRVSVDSSYPLDSWVFRLLSAPGKAPDFRVFGTSDVPEVRLVGGYEERRIEKRQVPARLNDERAPVDGSQGSRYVLSDWRTWAQVRDWALPLYRTVKAPVTTALAAQLTGGLAEPEAKALVLLEYVQDRIRYLGLEVGASTHRPRTPAEVLSTGFGDCKDKAVLFCSLAAAAGIEAWPVLVNNQTGRLVEVEGPTPGAFNHVIAAVAASGGVRYVDPTLDHQGGPLDQRVLDNYQVGLPVRPDAEGLVSIEGPSLGTRELIQTFRFTDFAAEGTVTMDYTFTGWDADQQRRRWEGLNLVDWKKDTREWLADEYGQVALVGDPVFRDDREKNVYTLSFSFSVKDFWKLDGELYRASSYPILVGAKLYDPTVSAPRVQPYGLEYPVTVRQVRRFVTPEAWKSQSQDKTVTGPGFRVWSSLRVIDPSTLEFEDLYEGLAPQVEPTDWEDYKTKIKEARNQVTWDLSPKKDSDAKAWTNGVADLSGGIVMGLVFLVAVLFQGQDF